MSNWCRAFLTHHPPLPRSAADAAAYFVYVNAEVLDADAFDAFIEAGDVFHKETALRLRKTIYSSGNSVEPAELYRRFRGRDATVEPMLRKKGLL